MSFVFYLFVSFAFVLFAISWISSRDDLAFRTFVIQSGSMEPSIMTGDIVVVKSQENYQPTEVITFLDTSNRVVTHRILEVAKQSDDLLYKTKGDANQSADPDLIPRKNIVGKVNLVVPKLGFAVAFAQSRYGILLFIVVPVVLIIYDELRKIFAEVKK